MIDYLRRILTTLHLVYNVSIAHPRLRGDNPKMHSSFVGRINFDHSWCHTSGDEERYFSKTVNLNEIKVGASGGEIHINDFVPLVS